MFSTCFKISVCVQSHYCAWNMPRGPINSTRCLSQTRQEPFNSPAAYAHGCGGSRPVLEPSLVTDQTRPFPDIVANICRRCTQSLSVLEVWGVYVIVFTWWYWSSRKMAVESFAGRYASSGREQSPKYSSVMVWRPFPRGTFVLMPCTCECRACGFFISVTNLPCKGCFTSPKLSTLLSYLLFCIIQGDSLLPSFHVGHMSSAGADRGVLLHPEKCAECTGLIFSSSDVA